MDSPIPMAIDQFQWPSITPSIALRQSTVVGSRCSGDGESVTAMQCEAGATVAAGDKSRHCGNSLVTIPMGVMRM